MTAAVWALEKDIEQQGLAKQLRQRLNKLRTIVASHQADWPAVSVDPDNVTYRRSVATVREANLEFSEFIRRLMA